MNSSIGAPYLEIIEQPKRFDTRFRYSSENHLSHLHGVNCRDGVKTYPKIKIHNLTCPALVVISLVTENAPYWPHPHGLHVKELNLKENMEIKGGVCFVTMTPDEPEFELKYVGIKCVTKNEITKKLVEREQIRVDPFKTGFLHRQNPKDINLSVVRLAFSFTLESVFDCQSDFNLNSVVSDKIYDEKTRTKLAICLLSHYSARVTGGEQILMFVEKINSRYQPQVRFFERDRKGNMTWERMGEFNRSDIHHQSGIAVRTPPYWNKKIKEPVEIFIQLVGTEEGETSEPLKFTMLPDERVPNKRPRLLPGNNFPPLSDQPLSLCECWRPSPDCLVHGKLQGAVNPRESVGNIIPLIQIDCENPYLKTNGKEKPRDRDSAMVDMDTLETFMSSLKNQQLHQPLPTRSIIQKDNNSDSAVAKSYSNLFDNQNMDFNSSEHEAAAVSFTGIRREEISTYQRLNHRDLSGTQMINTHQISSYMSLEQQEQFSGIQYCPANQSSNYKLLTESRIQHGPYNVMVNNHLTKPKEIQLSNLVNIDNDNSDTNATGPNVNLLGYQSLNSNSPQYSAVVASYLKTDEKEKPCCTESKMMDMNLEEIFGSPLQNQQSHRPPRTGSTIQPGHQLINGVLEPPKVHRPNNPMKTNNNSDLFGAKSNVNLIDYQQQGFNFPEHVVNAESFTGTRRKEKFRDMRHRDLPDRRTTNTRQMSGMKCCSANQPFNCELPTENGIKHELYNDMMNNHLTKPKEILQLSSFVNRHNNNSDTITTGPNVHLLGYESLNSNSTQHSAAAASFTETRPEQNFNNTRWRNNSSIDIPKINMDEVASSKLPTQMEQIRESQYNLFIQPLPFNVNDVKNHASISESTHKSQNLIELDSGLIARGFNDLDSDLDMNCLSDSLTSILNLENQSAMKELKKF